MDTRIPKYELHNKTSEAQKANRKRLHNLFANRPMPDYQLLTNLGLYMRSSALVQIMYVNELYQKIKNIPGVIMEFGTWWGQNLILFENFRAIHEPYNFTRKVIGFDTFEGYPELSENDIKSETIKKGGYSVNEGYFDYLNELIDYHEKENVMGHIKKHSIIKGNACETVEKYLKDNPETIIALTYFDMALYEPTKKVLQDIIPHLVKGSIIAMDEINNHDYQGETIALKEVIGLGKYQIQRSAFLPDRSYIIIE